MNGVTAWQRIDVGTRTFGSGVVSNAYGGNS